MQKEKFELRKILILIEYLKIRLNKSDPSYTQTVNNVNKYYSPEFSGSRKELSQDKYIKEFLPNNLYEGVLHWEKLIHKSERESMIAEIAFKLIVFCIRDLFFIISYPSDFRTIRKAINTIQLKELNKDKKIRKFMTKTVTIFKSIPLYLSIIALITFACSCISYEIFYNPLKLSLDIQLWLIRLMIYILFAWWLISLDFKKGVGELVGLAIAITSVSFLCTDNSMIYHSFNDINWAKGFCYTGLSISSIWLLYILFQSNTLLGFIVLINTIITLFIILPYGIPSIALKNVMTESNNSSSNDFLLFSFYTINDYRPFKHPNLNTLSFLLDIRILTITFFFGYLFLKSIVESTKISYEDNLAEIILRTENSVLQFLKAGIYFVWKIIQRVIFFGRNLSKLFFKNIWLQIKHSIKSYIYALLIVATFLIPILILKISKGIYFHDLNSKISLPTMEQIILLILIIILCSIPLFLVKLLKSEFSPFRIHNLYVKERPALFLPIYITLFSLGLTSIITSPLVKSYGNFLVFFVLVIIYAAGWGYYNHRRSLRTE